MSTYVKFNNMKYAFWFSLFFVFFLVNPVLAAEFFWVLDKEEYAIGENIEASLYLDTQNESINTISGNISIPSNYLSSVEVFTGGSIISLWIEDPSQNNKLPIIFSGIIPGGFSDPSGFVLSLVFFIDKKPVDNNLFIDIKTPEVYLNDGKGTKTIIKAVSKSIVFNKSKVQKKDIEVSDVVVPAYLNIEFAQDQNIFDNKYFLVFVAIDKGVGISHYEVFETKKEIIVDEIRKWHKEDSPYLIKDQSLRSYIYVKAVDKAGNEIVNFVAPQNKNVWYNYVYGIILLLIILFIFVLKKFKK